MLSQCWATVEDSEPTLSRHWVNVSREVPLCSGHSSMTTNAVKMWIERQINHYQHKSPICQHATGCYTPGLAFPYKLRYIVGFGLVEMDISTNPKPTIHRTLYGFKSQLCLTLSRFENTINWTFICDGIGVFRRPIFSIDFHKILKSIFSRHVTNTQKMSLYTIATMSLLERQYLKNVVIF